MTVVKNDLVGLKKTRQSLENQQYQYWKHIIIDGGSDRETLDYLSSLPQKNTMYLSGTDAGIYDAMNKAWKLAHPKSFIFYLNACDTFANPRSLSEASLALGNNPDSNWGCTTHEEIQIDGEEWVCKLVSNPSITNQLYAFGYRSHQAVVMRQDFIAILGGFNEEYKIAADWDLIVRAITLEKPTVWVTPLGKFELGGFSSKNLLSAHLELKTLRKKYIVNGLKNKILDDLWCAIYLDLFGYKNYFTPFLRMQKSYDRIRNKRNSRNWSLFPKQIKINFIFFSLIVVKNTRPSFMHFFNFKEQFYFFGSKENIVFWIHKKLNILPYTRPSDL